MAALAEALEEQVAPVADVQRPRTRAECDGASRPCPFVACRYNLFLDVNPKTGSIKLNFPDVDPGDMHASCVLDVAADGGESLEKVGELLNITRERARQLQDMGLVKLRLSRLAEEA